MGGGGNPINKIRTYTVSDACGNSAIVMQAITIKGGILSWQQVDPPGDCTGLDVDRTDGYSTPDDSKAQIGITAVCWDGKTYSNKNDPGKAFCTYKRVTIDACKGGGSPGIIYKAVAS